MNKENKPQLRPELNQELTSHAKDIEEAKKIARALRNNPLETRIWKLQAMFSDELSEQEIEEIAE
jgi:hypothetical protein